MITVLAAILWLHPATPVKQAKVYAKFIARESTRRDIDPLLVVAIIHLESRFNPKAKSKTHDYGLGQIHVSKTTHSYYLGRERLLFQPGRNIYLGVRMLRFWKNYHDKNCKNDHYWWIHYQHGKKVIRKGRTAGAGRRVWKIYRLLLDRFDRVPVASLGRKDKLLAACRL